MVEADTPRRSGDPSGDAGLLAQIRRLANGDGVVAGIALDHRDSFRAILQRFALDDLSPESQRELKLRLVRVLAPAATALMLDEELGSLALDRGVVPEGVGLIMPLEAQPAAVGDEPATRLMPDFGPADARRRGAAAGKLLVGYRSDRPSSSERQDAVIDEAIVACHAVGLPLVVEPVIPRLSTETASEYVARYPDLVVGAARRLRDLGVDLLKLPFPQVVPPVVSSDSGLDERAGLEACGRLDDACSGTPWVLLGGGIDTDVFIAQLRIAGAAGASGFLVGRGIWAQALDRDPEVVERAAEAARRDLERCVGVASEFARPLPTAA